MNTQKPSYVIAMLMTTLSTVMILANQKELAFHHLPAGIIPGIILLGIAIFTMWRHRAMTYSRIFLFIFIAAWIQNAIFQLAVYIPSDGKWPYNDMYSKILTIGSQHFIFDLLCICMIYILGMLIGKMLPRPQIKPTIEPVYKYYTIIGMIFVLVLLLSNITTQKVVHVGDIVVDVGTFYFPITYIFNNIFTEVYGYSASRRLIWTGLLCNVCMIALLQITVYLPHAGSWHDQHAYKMIAGDVPRIVLASIVGFFCGEFLNSYVLAKLKILTKGKMLWTRTIGSTIFGNAADSLMFNLFAFVAVIPLGLVFQVALWQYGLKVIYEIVATPITYLIVLTLKRKEKKDHFDYDTNFNPFLLEE